MKPRHKAREVALQILYRYDVAQTSAAAKPAGPSKPQMTSQMTIDELKKHFTHFQVPEPVQEFAAELVAGTLKHLSGLDQILEKHASNWKVGRMGFVDRSLLRMAIYEILKMPDTPSAVVIDEAIELGKQFGTAETPAFVNGILDAIKRAQAAGEIELGE
jgi:N utilization substance protein B